MSNYPIISPGKYFSVTGDDFFEACKLEEMEKYDTKGMYHRYINNYFRPLWSPRSFQFKLTKLTHSLGLGPSLYLMQLKYFGLCFLVMTFLGFLPYVIIRPGALNFGAYVEKYESWVTVENNE